MILRGSQVFQSGLIELKHTDFLSSIKRENMERPRYAIWARLRSRKRRKYQNYKYTQLDSIQPFTRTVNFLVTRTLMALIQRRKTQQERQIPLMKRVASPLKRLEGTLNT